jgi:hypothetical protein
MKNTRTSKSRVETCWFVYRRSATFREAPASPLRNSLGLSLFQLGPLSSVYFNRFSFHYLDLFPCGGEIDAFTNFPWLTTNLGARRATPNHLEGFTFKSNKCFTNCLMKSTSAKDGNGSLLLSITQTFTLSTQLTRYLKETHKEGVARALMASRSVFFVLE